MCLSFTLVSPRTPGKSCGECETLPVSLLQLHGYRQMARNSWVWRRDPVHPHFKAASNLSPQPGGSTECARWHLSSQRAALEEGSPKVSTWELL